MPCRPLYNYMSLVLAAMMPLISQAQQDPLSESAERLEVLIKETAQATPVPDKGSWKSQFIDKEDGWLDASEWLIENAYGFLPVPIIITEPAVDNGLGLAGIFFHKPKPDDPKPEEGEFLMTDLTAVAAAPEIKSRI